MADHEKIYGICENKCFVEVMSKEQTEAKLEEKQNAILVGTTTPASSLGEDGDIYLKYEV